MVIFCLFKYICGLLTFFLHSVFYFYFNGSRYKKPLRYNVFVFLYSMTFMISYRRWAMYISKWSEGPLEWLKGCWFFLMGICFSHFKVWASMMVMSAHIYTDMPIADTFNSECFLKFGLQRWWCQPIYTPTCPSLLLSTLNVF